MTPKLDRCDFSRGGYYFPEVICMGNALTSKLSYLITPLLRCRRGRVEYLILNSQSLNCRIYDEGTSARQFCAENTGKTWIDENTLSRITYNAQCY